MGFSVSGAAAIIFASMFIAFGVWYTAADNGFDQVMEAEDDRSEGLLETSNTVIDILSAEYGNNDELTVNVSNNGTTALSLNATDLLLDSEYVGGWEANATVEGDSETDLWVSGETLTITLTRQEQPARVKIATESGVSDAAEVVSV